jgi:lipopolysaccharide export system permease protein
VSRTLFRHLLGEYLKLLLGVLGVLTAIFLVGDFVDRAKSYTGPHWLADVAVLYGYKALLTVHQLAPAALLIAAGLLVTGLRKRGELTALRSLSFGPAALYVPVAVVALLIGLGLVAFGEAFVGHASRRVDEITLHRFKRWGDWRFYYKPKQWFRHDDRLFFLEEGDVQAGFRNVTVLRLSPDFRLLERLDAGRMDAVSGNRWKLSGVIDRTFDGPGKSTLRREDTEVRDLGITEPELNIRTGKPEQMRLAELRRQIRARSEVGLPVGQYRLALHDKFAYPLAGFPAALLAVALTLRRERSRELSSAMVQGLAITVLLWAVMVVAKTLVTSGRMDAGLASWLPAILMGGAALIPMFGASLPPKGAR